MRLAFAAFLAIATGSIAVGQAASAEVPEEPRLVVRTTSDAPMCYTCGISMQPAGSCFVCPSCATTSGCS